MLCGCQPARTQGALVTQQLFSGIINNSISSSPHTPEAMWPPQRSSGSVVGHRVVTTSKKGILASSQEPSLCKERRTVAMSPASEVTQGLGVQGCLLGHAVITSSISLE